MDKAPISPPYVGCAALIMHHHAPLLHQSQVPSAASVHVQIITPFPAFVPVTICTIVNSIVNCGLIICSSVSVWAYQSSERLQGLFIKELVGVVKPNLNGHTLC